MKIQTNQLYNYQYEAWSLTEEEYAKLLLLDDWEEFDFGNPIIDTSGPIVNREEETYLLFGEKEEPISGDRITFVKSDKDIKALADKMDVEPIKEGKQFITEYYKEWRKANFDSSVYLVEKLNETKGIIQWVNDEDDETDIKHIVGVVLDIFSPNIKLELLQGLFIYPKVGGVYTFDMLDECLGKATHWFVNGAEV